MWEGIRFSKSGCTNARTWINGQTHKDLETHYEVSESWFSMLASDHAKLVQEIPDAEFSASSISAAHAHLTHWDHKSPFLPEVPVEDLQLGCQKQYREGLQRRKGGNEQRKWKITGIYLDQYKKVLVFFFFLCIKWLGIGVFVEVSSNLQLGIRSCSICILLKNQPCMNMFISMELPHKELHKYILPLDLI